MTETGREGVPQPSGEGPPACPPGVLPDVSVVTALPPTLDERFAALPVELKVALMAVLAAAAGTSADEKATLGAASTAEMVSVLPEPLPQIMLAFGRLNAALSRVVVDQSIRKGTILATWFQENPGALAALIASEQGG